MKIKIVLCCLLVTVFANREKRFLIVPPTAPTRHQWIAGIGIPLDLENIAVTTGYVLKAQYFLPTQVNHLFPLNTWEDLEREELVRTRREVNNTEEVVLVDNSTGTKYSQYNVPAVIVEEGVNAKETGRGFANTEDDDELDFWHDDQVEKDSKNAETYWNGLKDPESDQGPDNSRWDAYKLLEGVTKSRGMGGKQCVLRTICESSASPISHKSGILGELLHILLTPSSSADKVSTKEHEEYVEAEQLGKDDPGACEEKYSDCHKSLIDVFTSFDNPFESLFSTFL